MKGIAIIVLVLVSFHGMAQQVRDHNEFYNRYMTHRVQHGLVQTEDLVEGSPHENSDFVAGVVVTKDANRYENIPLRYNIYADEIEFRARDGNVYFLHEPALVDHVIIAGDKYIHAVYASGNRTLYGFFKVKAEGEALLLLRQNMHIRQAEKPQPYKEAEPARFVRTQDEYFVWNPPAVVQRVSNRREMLAVFYDSRSEMNDFARKNRIRYRQLDDMILLVSHYNSLLRDH